MREILIDLIDHMIGSIESARVTGNKTVTSIDAIDADKTTIIQGKLKQPHPEFSGEFGVGRFSTLKGFLNFANFKSDDAVIKVVKKTKDGKEIPEEIIFSNPSTGTQAAQRFLHPDALPPKAIFKGATWDVTITPTVGKIQEFSALAGILASTDNYFVVKVVNNELVFDIGVPSGDRVSLVFATEVQGNITKGWSWPVSQFLQILKLANSKDITIKFSEQGVAEIDMDTEVATWSYILPARLK